MKVKVAKSMDFDKVPEFVATLVSEAEEIFRDCLNETTALSFILNEEASESTGLALIDKLRKKLADADFLLSDSNDILSEYVQALLQAKEESLAQDLQSTSENAEQYVKMTEELSAKINSEVGNHDSNDEQV